MLHIDVITKIGAAYQSNHNKITVLYGCGFKMLGLGQLGQNPTFNRKLVFKAPLMVYG